MKRCFLLLAALGLSLLAPRLPAAAQFVELTVELEMDGWSYWLLEDQIGLAAQSGKPRTSVFLKPVPMRFVVGTNMWMMESDLIARDAKFTRWFTGSRIIERTSISTATTGAVMRGPGVGEKILRDYPTDDGNPGRPAGSADMFMDASGMMGWLALCSGPALKREGRKIPPPSAFWKQHFTGDFEDKTVCFDDSLGLPKSIEVFTKQGQTIFRYQTRGATNVLGWNFPLEFYLIQYERRGPRTNSYEVDLTAKGRITAIAPGVEPRMAIWPTNAAGK